MPDKIFYIFQQFAKQRQISIEEMLKISSIFDKLQKGVGEEEQLEYMIQQDKEFTTYGEIAAIITKEYYQLLIKLAKELLEIVKNGGFTDLYN